MEIKILANDGISAIAKKELEEKRFRVFTEKISQDNLIKEINEKDFKVILVRSATKITKEILDSCSNIEMIGRAGVGMDNISVEYARKKGIIVFNTPSSSSQAVAELVFAHIFSLSRGLYDSNRQMPSSGNTNFSMLKKKYSKGLELRGKTLGILGFGRIGQNVAKYALGIGMKVLAFDVFINNKEIDLGIEGVEAKVNIKTVSKNKVFKESDIISVHVPLQKKPVIGKNEFEKIKKGSILINASRGGVVDEKAMLEALDNEKLTAVGVDVFANEPNLAVEILKHNKISLSPHIGAATIEAQNRIGAEIVQNIVSNYS